MKRSMGYAPNSRRRAIFNFLVLSVSLMVGQGALLAQSRAGTSIGPRESTADRAVEARLGDRASLSAANAEGHKRMAAETARYLETARIPIKPGKGEYFSAGDAQTFLLSSEEKLNVSNAKPARKVVSVINYKNGSANSVFYVIEAETNGDSIVYSLKQDAKVLKSVPVKLKRSDTAKGPGVDPCPEMNKQNAQLLASLQSEANQTCQTRGACIGVCSNNGASIAWTIVQIKPTNWRCTRLVSQDYSTFTVASFVAEPEPPRNPLFDWTIWKAIRNDSALFF